MTGTSDDYHVIDDGSTEYKTSKPSLATGDFNGNVGGTEDTGDDTKEKSKFKNPLANITAGDALGMFGNLYQGFVPYKNTLENRAGDTPNVNMFKDYGKEGLKTLDKTKGYVAGIRDENLQDVELARAGNVKRGRNSARGDSARARRGEQQKNQAREEGLRGEIGSSGIRKERKEPRGTS